MQTHPEKQLLFAVPHPIIEANTPIWWSGPCGTEVGESPPQIEIYQANPPQEATFVCWPPTYSHCKHMANPPWGAIFICLSPPYSHCKHPHFVEWTLRAWGWGEPPQIKFYQANPPLGAIFICWPPPNSQRIYPYLVGWTLRAPGWVETPRNKILPSKPTPTNHFCLLAPNQFLTLQGISDEVSMGGTPGGWHFWSPPGSVPSPGEMRSPCQISGWWLVWARRQAAGHTYKHTHTHTFIFI